MWKKQACRQAGISVQHFGEMNFSRGLYGEAGGSQMFSPKSKTFSSKFDDHIKMLLFNLHDRKSALPYK